MNHRGTIAIALISTILCANSPEMEGRSPGMNIDLPPGMAIELLSEVLPCKSLCLRLDRTPTKVGEPITGTITWRNAPEGAFLNAYLSPTTSRVNRVPHVENGRYGALLRRPYALPASSGTIRFRWKGRGFWCSPTGFSTICDELPPTDTYTFSVAVIDSQVSPMAVLQRSSSPQPLASPKKLAGVRTGPFELR